MRVKQFSLLLLFLSFKGEGVWFPNFFGVSFCALFHYHLPLSLAVGATLPKALISELMDYITWTTVRTTRTAMKNIEPPITETMAKIVILSSSSNENSILQSLQHSPHLEKDPFILDVGLTHPFIWNVGNIGHFRLAWAGVGVGVDVGVCCLLLMGSVVSSAS